MSVGGLRYERYGAAGEWMMRTGPDRAPLLFVPPLFEEMNRLRALIAETMRRLAAHGHAAILPDLPGTGESLRDLEGIAWEDWRACIAELGETAAATIAIRGGTLLDDAAGCPGWRLAPVDGASLVRDLERSGMVAGGGSAGYDPDPGLVDAIRSAKVQPKAGLRVVRLASDRGEADAKIEGPPLWRRSEPQNSSELCDAIARDIDSWMRKCGTS